jgi:CheY-like chemotaxis protein
MLTNIRLRRQNEDALVTAVSRANELAGKAAAAATAKSMFLAHMSHEIRTPLNAVLGWAQILNRDCKTCSSGRVAAKAIIKGGEHLLELINDILDLVRSDAGIMVLKPVGFDFCEMLRDIVLMHRQQMGSGINIETVIDPDIPLSLFADKCKIRQVLINLISNAISFTQHGGVCVAASIKECPDEAWLMLSVDVIDSGCGIESDQFERIFKPFEQLDRGQQKRKGSGLGLPLSRRYAQAMGGDVVVVSSVPGKGSAFCFTFKVQRGKADLTGSTEASLPVKQIVSGQRILRILAVDDDPANLQMLQFMLKEAGFAVETAESGAGALDKIRAGSGFDLVLMDRRMPGMDGIETIRNLRNLCPGQKIPVVMVTANEPDEGEMEPVDGYVSKPVSRDVLFKEIQRVTGVQYEYDRAAAAPSGCRYAVAPDAFHSVPFAQREALQTAVDAGDVRKMRDVSEDIRRDHPALAEVLDDLISLYDYDELNRLLKHDEGVT